MHKQRKMLNTTIVVQVVVHEETNATMEELDEEQVTGRVRRRAGDVWNFFCSVKDEQFDIKHVVSSDSRARKT